MELESVQPGWKREYILTLRETSMERKAVAKPLKALAAIHNNANWERRTTFSSRKQHDEIDVLEECFGVAVIQRACNQELLQNLLTNVA